MKITYSDAEDSSVCYVVVALFKYCIVRPCIAFKWFGVEGRVGDGTWLLFRR